MRRPEEFADAVTEMYVTGVSTRKVKKALKAVAGDDVRLSRSTVSRITKRLRDEYTAWCTRSLSELKVIYIFFDAIRVGMRIGDIGKDCVLIAYAVLENGEFETLSVGLGNTESSGTWEDFIVDLKKRGLQDPLLCISDGNVGLCSMIDKYFETSYRQRCVKHKMENILNQIPKEKHGRVQPKLNRIFYGATSLEQAKQALKDFKREYGKIYPSAIARLEDDLDQSLMFYLFPSNHWKRIRTSNRLERLNKELRRRLRVIGRHPSERGCLSLVFQICKRYQENKNAFRANDLVQALWRRLRNEKLEMITQLTLDLKAA
jgi:transposase-like protein